MSKFRVRCNACSVNFCSDCGLSPYHLGKTCEAYKQHKDAKKCRYCDSELGKAKGDVCKRKDCVILKGLSCTKTLQCGHQCRGFKNEKNCLPCLDEDCAQEESKSLLADTNNDTFCSICWVSGLGTEPCVQIGCKHVFHLRCLQQIVEKKWVTPRIVFNFLNCPSCKQRINADHCPQLKAIIDQSTEIEKVVINKSVERAKHEGLDKHQRLKTLGDPFYNKLQEFAMYKCAYYMCFKCHAPYFGGMKDCEQNNL